MERLIKVLGVLAVVLLISTTASAATLYWGVPGNWTDTAMPGYTSAPSAALGDYVYVYTTTVANPLVVTGSACSADFVHLSAFYGQHNALEVTGSLDTTAAINYDGIYFGAWGGSGDNATLTIQDGGSLVTGNFVSASGATGVSNYSIVLNGGILDIGTIAADSSFLINIADYDATLILPQADYNALAAVGGVTGADTIVMTDLGGGIGAYSLIPEPSTMALLGLGALVLLRKK
jgi:hypothetical protein